MRRSDTALTFALCASLVVHALIGLLLIRDRVAYLASQLVSAPVERVVPPDDPDDEDGEDFAAADPPAPLIRPDAPQITPEVKPPAPSPPPQRAKAPRPDEDNSEWGEKNGKGFAITSAPGKDPMSARKGIQDQSYASRDPQGPEPFPDEPSMSTVLPGENGDGQKASRAALADKGTESTAPTPLTPPGAPAVPPPPIPQRVTIARADETFIGAQTSGRSASILPAAERRSPAEENTPPGDDDLLPNDPALGQEEQILPYKPKDFIGIRSNKPAYPQVVVALTRPPGTKLASERNDPLNDVVLANRVTADVSGSPPIQPATAALDVPRQRPEEMARLLGATDPLNGLVRVDAMTHPPGTQPLEGGDAPLPELVQADRPNAAETRDAIESLTAPDPKPLEMAQAIEPTPIAATTAASPSPQPPVTAANTAVASATKATGGLPGPTAAAADPAPDTGLESDPFAKIPGVEFHPGKVEARSGRQIKPVRPRLSEAGKRDLLAQAFPTILLKVRIDKTGKVVDVSIVHGSGNEAIDMPVYRALWEWWFEPPTDKKGNPMEDVQLVAIHWG